MYFIKTKGTEKVADYVQIRDENFSLSEIVKLSSLEKKLKIIFPENYKKIYEKIINSDFGTFIKPD